MNTDRGFPLFLRRPRLVIACCALLWAFCYPPFPLGPLAFVVLAPAFVATEKLTRRGAFAAWFYGGLLYNTAMYWWIWQVMKVGPAVVVGLGLVALVGFLSLFNGLIGLGYRAAQDSPRRPLLLALYPLAWAGLEAARAVGEMSFPWNNLGYTLGAWPVLFQSASSWGVYGLSALMIGSNLLLAGFIRGGTRRRTYLIGCATIPFAMAVHGMWMLSRADDSAAPRLDITLVQPSIPQTKKWDEAYFAEVIAKTFRTMYGTGGDAHPVRGSDLIVLAETAVPDFLRMRPELVDSLRGMARATGAPVLVGALDYVPERHPWSEYAFYNSAFLFSPDSAESLQRPAQYAKLRLVPFSEALPFKGVLPLLNYVETKVGSGGFSPGDGYRVWNTRGISWSPSICYEVIYPSFARAARAAGAKLLVNVTNDGWFGRSNGPYQHANIARFRAAENGMPVARCANNGVSVFYDAWGRDLGRTALMDSTVLRRQVSVPDRITAYSRLGDAVDGFFLTALGVWILALFAWRRDRRRTTLTT
jgi:apolipoprotein N-acyltransferase